VLGRDRTVLFHRELPWRNGQAAMAVVTAYLAMLCVGTFAMLVSEGRGMVETLFEAASALGTVGLSLGITPTLTVAGKLIAVLLMLAGRLGPLTLAMALAGPVAGARVRYPEARIMTG